MSIHPAVAQAIRSLDAVVIGPGSFFTSLLPIFLVDGCREALAEMRGPIIHVANLLTEGRGMSGFTAGDAVERLNAAIGRPVDVVIFNVEPPPDAVLERYAASTSTRCRSGAFRMAAKRSKAASGGAPSRATTAAACAPRSGRRSSA